MCEACGHYLQAFIVESEVDLQSENLKRCLCYYCTASMMLRAHCNLEQIRNVIDIVDRNGAPLR